MHAEPPATKPVGCSHFKLRQLLRRVGRLYDQELAKAGLKTTQYSLLSHLVKLGPIRPGELAAALRMDASTLTRNLQPLQQAGWVVVGPGADARSRLVRLTEAGRAKRSEASRHWRVAQATLNERLGPARVQALHTLIDESLARLPAPDDEARDERA